MKTFFFLAFTSVCLAQTSVQPVPCNKPVQTSMIFPTGDAGPQNIPSTYAGASSPAPARKSILVCNARDNLGSPVFRCRWDFDGGWPSTGTGPNIGPGVSLGVGDCINLTLPSGALVRCNTASVDAGLEATECR